jgi:integrase
VFRQAAREGLIEAAPVFTWKAVKGNKRPLYYTPDQLSQIDAYFNDDHPQAYMRHFCTIAAQTGMRLGEILKINPQTLVDVDGKPCVYLETTKNGDERLVPLTGQARAAVKALGDNPARHWTHRSFYDGLKGMRCRLFNGDSRYCFHTFRHTAATHLAAADRSTAMIALLLGHKSEATTRKYIKPKPSALRGLVEMLEQQ